MPDPFNDSYLLLLEITDYFLSIAKLNIENCAFCRKKMTVIFIQKN